MLLAAANQGPGSRLYLTGVVHPGRKMLYEFSDPNTGEVLDTWITAEAEENGVVHHEREEFWLDRLRRGPVRVTAYYLTWEGNQPVSQTVIDLNLTDGGGGGGGGGGSGGGGGGCLPDPNAPDGYSPYLANEGVAELYSLAPPDC